MEYTYYKHGDRWPVVVTKEQAERGLKSGLDIACVDAMHWLHRGVTCTGDGGTFSAIPARSAQEFGKHADIMLNNLAIEAEQIVECLARKVLKRCPYLKEFMMGMGCCEFIATRTDHQDRPVYYDQDNYNQHMTEFFEFIARWGEQFKITGSPMRFTKDGPKITNW